MHSPAPTQGGRRPSCPSLGPAPGRASAPAARHVGPRAARGGRSHAPHRSQGAGAARALSTGGGPRWAPAVRTIRRPRLPSASPRRPRLAARAGCACGRTSTSWIVPASLRAPRSARRSAPAAASMARRPRWCGRGGAVRRERGGGDSAAGGLPHHPAGQAPPLDVAFRRSAALRPQDSGPVCRGRRCWQGGQRWTSLVWSRAPSGLHAWRATRALAWACASCNVGS